MIIVNGQNIKKYHGANLVLSGAAFEIRAADKVGLIGRNGSGKSTLLKLIAKALPADEGQLAVKKDLKIGYLPQTPESFDSMTVYDVLADGCRELLEDRRKLAELETAMAGAKEGEELERLLQTYAVLQERFERGGGYGLDASIDQVATGLGIGKDSYGRSFGSLSGGEKTRVVLGSQLIGSPELLLLDEPTNHLDLSGIEWLEQYLQQYAGAFIVVSHDRYFLDSVVRRIVELEDGEAHAYETNYSGYVAEKEARLLRQFEQYKDQQKTIRKMKEAIRRLEEWGRIGSNEKFFKRAASMRKALERMEPVKRPVLERKSADFELALQDRSGRRVLAFEGLSKAFGGRAVLTNANGSLLYGEKIALVGENGSGKSTLIRLLLGELAPDSGEAELGSRVEIGYLAQQEPPGEGKKTVLDYFREEAGLEEGEARGVLARYLFYGADAFKSVGSLSGGEWSRLRLALLVRKKPNLLILDEPTNHLDIDSREALEEALEEYAGTVLAISHDRYFINRLAQRVWELRRGEIAEYLGNFDEYRAKRRQLESAVPEGGPPPGRESAAGAAQRAAGAKAAGAKPAAPPPRAGTGASETRAGERRREQLERRIAELEAALAAADAELQRRSGEGAASPLEALWREREALRERHDALLEEWLELG